MKINRRLSKKNENELIFENYINGIKKLETQTLNENSFNGEATAGSNQEFKYSEEEFGAVFRTSKDTGRVLIADVSPNIEGYFNVGYVHWDDSGFEPSVQTSEMEIKNNPTMEGYFNTFETNGIQFGFKTLDDGGEIKFIIGPPEADGQTMVSSTADMLTNIMHSGEFNEDEVQLKGLIDNYVS